MEFGAAFPADSEALEVVEQGESLLDDVAELACPVPLPVERRGRGLDIGRAPEHDLRPIVNAILYVDRTEIPWRYLPDDAPPWETVYKYFVAWQKEGIFNRLNGLLCRLVREAESRDVEPSACVLDA